MNQTAYTKITSAKKNVLFDLITEHFGIEFEHILVIGCGAGDEAIDLSQRFNADSVGIDLSDELFVKTEDPRVTLRMMDACQMDFSDATFDLIYSFHALEHIHPLDAALSEMQRVLKPGGVFCVGTPNKLRIAGYVGSATTLRNKLLWNLNDWKMRIMGRWENKLGAHAGFTRSELQHICLQTFGNAMDVTDDYYHMLYGQQNPKLVRGLLATPLKNYLLPAVYTLGSCQPLKFLN